MAPPPGPPPGAPMDSRSKDLLITIPTLTVFATIFVVVRMTVSWKNRKFFLLTDHLLIIGAILNVVANTFSYRMALAGAGKHMWDPSMTPVNIAKYMKYLWFAQLLNIYAMAFVKGSICAYLLMLNFSKGFRIAIWISVIFHVATNFIFPSVILYGECTPIAKHWDLSLDGSCWPETPRVVSGYLGAASNIVTDLFYTSAPLVYLSSVQLAKRTKWGVRVVFLLALLTTTISALKLYEMRALHDSQDPTYKSTDLTIFSVTEVASGIFTSCLPPLRKTFENLLRKVLPESIMGTTRKQGSSYALPAYGSQLSRISHKPKHETDDESEKAILPDRIELGTKGGILRTTSVSVLEASESRDEVSRDGNFI